MDPELQLQVDYLRTRPNYSKQKWGLANTPSELVGAATRWMHSPDYEKLTKDQFDYKDPVVQERMRANKEYTPKTHFTNLTEMQGGVADILNTEANNAQPWDFKARYKADKAELEYAVMRDALVKALSKPGGLGAHLMGIK